jgi:hypothetical protein
MILLLHIVTASSLVALAAIVGVRKLLQNRTPQQNQKNVIHFSAVLTFITGLGMLTQGVSLSRVCIEGLIVFAFAYSSLFYATHTVHPSNK